MDYLQKKKALANVLKIYEDDERRNWIEDKDTAWNNPKFRTEVYRKAFAKHYGIKKIDRSRFF